MLIIPGICPIIYEIICWLVIRFDWMRPPVKKNVFMNEAMVATSPPDRFVAVIFAE